MYCIVYLNFYKNSENRFWTPHSNSLTVHLVKIRELKIQTPSIATHGARLDSTVKKTTIRALK